MSNDKGQVILILILVMTVALSIGLSVVQKSLVDVSTASKVEQSSRAFSAAEAGIEKALRFTTGTDCTNAVDPLNCQNFSGNSAQIARIEDAGLLPLTAVAPEAQAALEYPPLAKEDVVQVWLADPAASLPACAVPYVCYSQPTLDVYWGNSDTDKAALELTLVYFDSENAKYAFKKWYLDHSSSTRINGFDKTSLCNKTPWERYQCYKQLTGLPSRLMLLRARLLYNSASQPFAVKAVDTCGTGCSLPPQARSIISTGAAGETQRKVKVFQLNKVVPPFFDYAIFSAGEIKK